MKYQLRKELCRALILAGETLPEALKGWDDEQTFLWFKTSHEIVYRRVCGLPPRLEIMK